MGIFGGSSKSDTDVKVSVGVRPRIHIRNRTNVATEPIGRAIRKSARFNVKALRSIGRENKTLLLASVAAVALVGLSK